MPNIGKLELGTALVLSEAAGAMLPASGAEIASADIVGKVSVERTELRALGTAELDNVSDAKWVDGIGGKFNWGNDTDVEAVDELLEVIKLGGSSGSLEPGRFVAPADKEELNPEYWICCNNEGGTESPGGGRSNDCWCK